MIENTENTDPLTHIIGSLAMGPSEYIEHTEAQGQRQLVASDLLPIEITGRPGVRNVFLHLGFVFGDAVEDDPLFQHVTLPEGWYRKGSDHDMWSYLVDDEGNRRVAIFYKAAFYDRKAFMRLLEHSEVEQDRLAHETLWTVQYAGQVIPYETYEAAYAMFEKICDRRQANEDYSGSFPAVVTPRSHWRRDA